MKSTKRRGNIGEAKVVADLLEQGIEVALPFGDNLPFDLIAVGPDFRLWKLQVKFASARQGVIRIKNWRQSENTRRRYERIYTATQVDIFAIYCPDTEKVYYVPQQEIGQRAAFHLRIAPARNQQRVGIHWHEDYRSFRDASETTSSGPEMVKI
jgi:hypothetical protein